MAFVKRLSLFLVFGFSLWSTAAQEIVSWIGAVEKISDSEYRLQMDASIKEGWYLYSIKELEGELVPIPTTFEFEKAGQDYELKGALTESKPKIKYDEVFEMELSYFSNSARFWQNVNLLENDINSVRAIVQYQACDDEACIYREAELYFSLDGSAVQKEEKIVDAASMEESKKLVLPLKNTELLEQIHQGSEKSTGLTTIFMLGLLGGFLAILTPCVFPMIPLTVSFFTKQNKNKRAGKVNATIYGLFILLIYGALSLPFHLLDSVNPQILNTIATNVWLNLFFFAILVVFAFSFFGFFEITLPGSWSNRMDSASGVGGYLGIFFMALTLAIISFSCTGPILGSLLAGSLTGEGDTALQLTAGMLGFGLALALPFALFALFPNWLKTLPQSGGWMNSIKIILGFLELAFAFKFLSNADLVANAGLFKREIFIGIWMLIFILLALYLLGFLSFKHEDKNRPRSWGFKIFGLLCLLFTVYLGSGLGKNSELTMLSGFPPPQFYSIYEQPTDCPLGLNCYKDFETGLQAAKKAQKPLLIDFTGWACVNCRRMEERVWSKNEIYELLKNEYVLTSLYVDDRKELSAAHQFDFKMQNGYVKAINTVGEKWATFQAINFKSASQPYYVLMSPDYEILLPPEKYSDSETYKKWLQDGLRVFKSAE